MLNAQKKRTVLLIIVGTIVAVIGSAFLLELSFSGIITALPKFIVFFVTRFLPPDFSEISIYIPVIMETVYFSIATTSVSTVLSLILAGLMSERLNPRQSVRVLVRGLTSFLRNIPVVVWTAVLVYIFGIGSLVGLIALVMLSIGFLSKGYAEAIDELANEPFEALEASGASQFQIIYHGLFPQFFPAWVSWTLFSFELNLRASTILGLVGAGGIGVQIQTSINIMRYQEGMAMIIVVLVMVLLTELGTKQIRKMVE